MEKTTAVGLSVLITAGTVAGSHVADDGYGPTGRRPSEHPKTVEITHPYPDHRVPQSSSPSERMAIVGADGVSEFSSASCTMATPVSTSARLAGLDLDAMANARIELEPIGEYEALQLKKLQRIEDLWNQGRFFQALAYLDAFEKTGVAVALGVSWRQPLSRPEKIFSDSRIGGSRTEAQDVALDVHQGTGNLFAVVDWNHTWTVNISTDGGDTWVETYAWSAVAGVADMAVAGDHVWVGYAAVGDSYTTARMRRFHAADGVSDSAYNGGSSFVIVADETPYSVSDIVVGSNVDDLDNRVYLTYIVSDNTIGFWWDALDGLSFSSFSPTVTNADTGLDFAWNPHSVLGFGFWLSFIGTDDQIHIWRSDGAIWNDEVDHAYLGSTRGTKISAFRDEIYCVVSWDHGSVGYLASPNAGETIWWIGFPYSTGGALPWAANPAVSNLAGTEVVIVFNRGDGDFDGFYSTSLGGWLAGDWSSPLSHNDVDAVSGSKNSIEWLGRAGIEAYGLVYIADGAIPYFDLLPGGFLFSDGFESGSTDAWSSAVP